MSSNSIDLHGYNRVDALQALAHALERCATGTTLEVITGTGQHSNEDGAVLRPAVKKFLTNRGFRYEYTAGVYRVNGGSGVLRALAQSTTPSTKLIVDAENGKSVPVKKEFVPFKGKRQVAPTKQPIRPTGLPGTVEVNKKKKNVGNSASLLEEIRQDNQMLETCKKTSIKELQEMQRLSSEEEEALQRALEISTGDDMEEDEEFRKVVELSMVENLKPSSAIDDVEDDENFRKIVARSLVENVKPPTEEEDEELRRVFEESAREASERDDEDALILKALEISTQENVANNEDVDFEKVLKASVLETGPVSESDLLRQAIEDSMKEASSCYVDEYDAVD